MFCSIVHLEEMLYPWSQPPVPPINDHGQILGDDGRTGGLFELKEERCKIMMSIYIRIKRCFIEDYVQLVRRNVSASRDIDAFIDTSIYVIRDLSPYMRQPRTEQKR